MPTAYKRCSKCGTKIKSNLKMCDACNNARHRDYNNGMRDKDLQKIYNSKEWKSIRLEALHRDDYCCVQCRREGRISIAQEVDHIRELRDGGEPYRLDNLQSLCKNCHSIKTARERERR